MDRETLTTVAERYPWSSWAVWDDGFPDGDCVEDRPDQLVEFVREHVGDLTPDVVLMGLNRSDDLPAPFSNFHAPTRTHYDYWSSWTCSEPPSFTPSASGTSRSTRWSRISTQT